MSFFNFKKVSADDADGKNHSLATSSAGFCDSLMGTSVAQAHLRFPVA